MRVSVSDFSRRRTITGALRLRHWTCSQFLLCTTAQLSSSACDADLAVLPAPGAGRSHPAWLLQEPAPHTLQRLPGSKVKAQEKTLLPHTRLQYILSALLAGRPNDTFPLRTAKWIILSVLGVTFMCLWECDPYSLCCRHEPDAFL